jgi:hypothetical protein
MQHETAQAPGVAEERLHLGARRCCAVRRAGPIGAGMQVIRPRQG